ncbi:MAG: glycosyltransferase [Geminicoccaceae bacterium]
MRRVAWRRAVDGGDGRPVKVLAWPAFRKRASNPHAALLYERLRDLGVEVEDWTPGRACLRSADLWHLHHPETVVYLRSSLRSALTTLAFCALLALARLRGIRILWTVHDLGSHDELHPKLEAWFWPFFVSRVDAYVCLSDGGCRQARERFPGLRERPGFTVPHGHYRDAYPNQVSRAVARRTLGLPEDAQVLLHFGLLRPYKNAPHLIRTFRELPQAKAILVMAGKPYDGIVEREVRLSADGCPRIRLLLRWIPLAEVQYLFVASDLVVLPYRRILNSGTVLLALSFGRPVLVPDKGAMREQQRRFGSEWIRLYSGELSARDLSEAAAWATSTVRAAPPDLAGLDWESLAQKTQAVYEALLAAGDRQLACRSATRQ